MVRLPGETKRDREGGEGRELVRESESERVKGGRGLREKGAGREGAGAPPWRAGGHGAGSIDIARPLPARPGHSALGDPNLTQAATNAPSFSTLADSLHAMPTPTSTLSRAPPSLIC